MSRRRALPRTHNLDASLASAVRFLDASSDGETPLQGEGGLSLSGLKRVDRTPCPRVFWRNSSSGGSA